MTKEEFEKVLSTHSSYVGRHKKLHQQLVRRGETTNIQAVDGKPDYYRIFSGDSVTTGGSSGGDCWGGTSSSFSTNNSAGTHIQELVDFLTAHYPEVSFLAYQRVLAAVKVHGHHTSEYYGNYTDYEFPYITHSDLVTAIYG